MRYLFDSSFWIEVWRPKPNLTENLQKAIELLNDIRSTPFISGMVLAELKRGLSQSKTDQKRLNHLMELEYAAESRNTYLKAGELARKLDEKGQTLGIQDCLIAVCALQYDAVLVAKDKHFQRFSGLTVLLV